MGGWGTWLIKGRGQAGPEPEFDVEASSGDVYAGGAFFFQPACFPGTRTDSCDGERSLAGPPACISRVERRSDSPWPDRRLLDQRPGAPGSAESGCL